jgi:hypothetical protein
MQAWAKQQAVIGLSAAQAGNAAALLGSQLKNAGYSAADAAKQSQSLVSLGADLAATYGGDAATAVDALSAALKGEYDSMEKYGTSLSAAKVQQEALTLGLWNGKGAMDESARAAATLSLITRQTTDAQGQSAREADTFAGAQGRAFAEAKNLAAELGTALLPYMAQAADAFAKGAAFAREHTTAVRIGIGVIAALAAGILAANVAMKLYTAATTALTVAQKVAAVASKAWAAAQVLLNIALTANPIGLVVVAIAALVAGLVLAYKKSDAFREIVDTVARVLRGALLGAFNAVKGAVNALADAFSAAWDWMSRLIAKAGDLAAKLNPLKGLSGLLGRVAGASASALVAAPASPTMAAATYSRSSATSSSPAPVVVTQEQVARALSQLLFGSAARNGQVVMLG